VRKDSGRKSRRNHNILRGRKRSVKKKDAPDKLMLTLILPIAQNIASPHGRCVWFARKVKLGGRGGCVTPALLITEKGSVRTAQKVDTNACQGI